MNFIFNLSLSLFPSIMYDGRKRERERKIDADYQRTGTAFITIFPFLIKNMIKVYLKLMANLIFSNDFFAYKYFVGFMSYKNIFFFEK